MRTPAPSEALLLAIVLLANVGLPPRTASPPPKVFSPDTVFETMKQPLNEGLVPPSLMNTPPPLKAVLYEIVELTKYPKA